MCTWDKKFANVSINISSRLKIEIVKINGFNRNDLDEWLIAIVARRLANGLDFSTKWLNKLLKQLLNYVSLKVARNRNSKIPGT